MVDQNNPLKELEERQEKEHAKTEAAFQERMRQDEQRRSNLELERVQRVTGSGLSEDAYAVREILLIVRRAPHQDFYQPSLLQLGFSDTIDAMTQASRFFKTLQEKGCFREVERSTNSVFTIKGPSIRLLKRELKELKQIEDGAVEIFFRRISHGFIGVKHVLGFVAATFAVISGVQGYMLQRTDDGSVDSFPFVSDPDEPFKTSYKVCENPTTGTRIYQSSFSGDDSGWASFYNENGELIEATPEMGPGAMNNLQPTTKVKNCIRTTENYFKSHVKVE